MHTHFLLFVLNTLNVILISLFTLVFISYYMEWKILNPLWQCCRNKTLIFAQREMKRSCNFARLASRGSVIVLEIFCCAVTELRSVIFVVFLLGTPRTNKFCYCFWYSHSPPAECVQGGTWHPQTCGQWAPSVGIKLLLRFLYHEKEIYVSYSKQ